MAEQTGRSLQLVGEELVKANTALTKFGSKRDLAADLKMSPTTITNFFAGRPVQRKQFHAICKKLKLDWQPDQTQPSQLKTENSDVEELVREVRTQIRPLIQERCGTMRVLDMSQPLGLGEIYTHVNILEKISSRTRRDLAELMPKADLGDFERYSLGRVREERIPGLKAVEKYSKLMILGKPGAGKTTFLKHLAIECNGENFQAERVPLFITLKEFAETEGQPDLIAFMESLIHRCGRGLAAMAQSNPTTIQTILENGRALILLDGLDEVRETDASRVLRQIQRLADRYAGNAFIITCRIAAREYTFQQFTDVEVADFDDDQIADVSGKWFRCKQDGVKAERFLEKLKDNPRIRDLASSPLLLTLLCLVFEESGDFPANRAELYQEGVDILLKKWDAKRNIERDQIYKKLSLKRKEDLLSQLAWRTFAAGNYFFKQTDVERYIHEFIEHLPGASTDEDTLNLDSAAVLKSIEAQHGLLVERAYRIYSFSHLTFHEYFAAREAKEKAHILPLADHLTDKRWREVILLTVGMVPTADTLLQQMKQAIDQLLAGDKKLQTFLQWVNDKAQSVQAPYKRASICAFYFEIDLALVNVLDQSLDLHFDLTLVTLIDYALNLDYALDLDFELAHVLAYAQAMASYQDIECALVFDHILTLARANQKAPKLHLKLDELAVQLPKQNKNFEIWQTWWQEYGAGWTKQLRQVVIEHCNIGHDWQFSKAQRKKLLQYYDANKLLVECLNSDCYVSRTVRQEIEDTLLLPLSELEQRPSSQPPA